jgi:hypothetical protein
MLSPERESGVPLQERPEQVDLTTGLKREGVQSVPSQPTPLTTNKGQTLIHPVPGDTSGQATTVTMPMNQTRAANLAQGSTTNSSTWLGKTILRKFQKALLFGWRIIIGQSTKN